MSNCAAHNADESRIHPCLVSRTHNCVANDSVSYYEHPAVPCVQSSPRNPTIFQSLYYWNDTNFLNTSICFFLCVWRDKCYLIHWPFQLLQWSWELWRCFGCTTHILWELGWSNLVDICDKSALARRQQRWATREIVSTFVAAQRI